MPPSQPSGTPFRSSADRRAGGGQLKMTDLESALKTQSPRSNFRSAANRRTWIGSCRSAPPGRRRFQVWFFDELLGENLAKVSATSGCLMSGRAWPRDQARAAMSRLQPTRRLTQFGNRIHEKCSKASN